MSDNINFESEFAVTEKEKEAYIEAVKEHLAAEGKDANLLDTIKLSVVKDDPEACSVSYKLTGQAFERIRRITGNR